MRADGKRVKDVNPMYQVAAYIMDKRYDAMNMIELNIPIAPIQAYLSEKRKQGYRFSHLGVVLAAYLRAAAEFPQLNQFIVNKKLYQRNEFAVGMVVLKPGVHDGTMNKMYFQMENTVFDVHRIMEEYVEENRQQGDTNKTDDMIKFLLSIPGLCNFGVGLFKLLDKWGLLSKKILQASPFHISLLMSNLGSIRTNHIYHHVYEFGTTSIAITLGNMREVPKRVRGEIVFERCLPMGVVMDERICSGSYFAEIFGRIKHYLANPELLEAPPTVVNTRLD